MDNYQLADFISQIFIFIFNLSAILMVSCFKNKWGNVVGLIHQPFWYYTTLYNEQWGLFLLSLAYTVIWSIGIWQWFYKDNLPKDS